MKHPDALWAIAFTAFCILIFYALLGFIYLHTTRPLATTVNTCDRITRFDGSLYCMAMMNKESDSLMVTRPQ